MSKLTLQMVVFCLGCFGLSGGAHAVTWSELSDQEKRILNRFEEQWQNLPDERQNVLHKRARRWGQMSPDERHRAKQRFEQWRSCQRKSESA